MAAKVDHQTAKFSSPPNFSAIYIWYSILLVLDMYSTLTHRRILRDFKLPENCVSPRTTLIIIIINPHTFRIFVEAAVVGTRIWTGIPQ